MRSELQKKVDKTSGVMDLEYNLNKITGKIVETGKLEREIDPAKIEAGLTEYKQHLLDLETQVKQAEEKLKEIEAIEEDEEIKKFNELQQKIQKLAQRKGLQDLVQKKTEELEFHQDTYKEQTRLVNEWREWKKKMRK